MATISIENIEGDIKRHLSIIGKRLYDKEGKNLFSNITVSSAEPSIFTQYSSAATQNIASVLAQFVTGYTDTSIEVEGTRWNDALVSSVQNAARSYAIFFSVGEYLAMTHPELAEKYYKDAGNMIQTIVTLAYHKNPPKIQN